MICHDQRRGVLELTERNEQKSRRRRGEKEQLKLIKKNWREKRFYQIFLLFLELFFLRFFGLFTVDKRGLPQRKSLLSFKYYRWTEWWGVFLLCACLSVNRLTSITRTTNRDRRGTKEINFSKSFLQLREKWAGEKRDSAVVCRWIFSQGALRWAEWLSKRSEQKKTNNTHGFSLNVNEMTHRDRFGHWN